MTGKSNLEVVRQQYDRFLAGDVEGFFAHFTEDARLEEPESLPYGGHFEGRENVITAIGRMMTFWKDIHLDFQEILASERSVVALTTFSATAAATGRKVSFPMIEIWEVTDGKISLVRPIYGDTALALRALED